MVQTPYPVEDPDFITSLSNKRVTLLIKGLII